MSAALFAEFDPAVSEALLLAVEANRADLDAMAEQYAREQAATAQSEADYQANVEAYNP